MKLLVYFGAAFVLLAVLSGCIGPSVEDCGELIVSNEQLTNSPEEVFFSNEISCIQKSLETCKPAKITIATDNSKVYFEIAGEGLPLKQQRSIDENRVIKKRDLATCKINMKMLKFPSHADLEGLNASCNWIKNDYFSSGPLGACEGPLIEGYKKYTDVSVVGEIMVIIVQYGGLLSTFAPNCTMDLFCWNAMLKRCMPALMPSGGDEYNQTMGEYAGKCLTIKYSTIPERPEFSDFSDITLLKEYCEYEKGKLIGCNDLRPKITIKEFDPLNPESWKELIEKGPNVRAEDLILTTIDLPGFKERGPFEEDVTEWQALSYMFENEDLNLSVVNKIAIPKIYPKDRVDSAYEGGIEGLRSLYGAGEVAILEENKVGEASTLLKVGGNLYILYFKKSNILSTLWVKSLILSEEELIQKINSYAEKVERKITDNVE